jgi:putative hydrolase
VRLLADLHTHSIASGHAYSTITELAVAAREKGLELIAVCDHGPGLPGSPHEWYFTNLKIVPSVIGGVRVLKGIEANLIAPGAVHAADSGNGLDLDDFRLEKLDLVAVGVHPECGFDDASEAVTTEALVRVMANPLVDMVTHAGNPAYPVDVEAVVEAAVAHDVIVEINNASYDGVMKRAADTGRERARARAAAAAGAFVAITSDAHYHSRVGDFGHAIRVAEEFGIDPARIVSRDAASVLAHLQARRERPRLDMGGVV